MCTLHIHFRYTAGALQFWDILCFPNLSFGICTYFNFSKVPWKIRTIFSRSIMYHWSISTCLLKNPFPKVYQSLLLFHPIIGKMITSLCREMFIIKSGTLRKKVEPKQLQGGKTVLLSRVRWSRFSLYNHV